MSDVRRVKATIEVGFEDGETVTYEFHDIRPDRRGLTLNIDSDLPALGVGTRAKIFTGVTPRKVTLGLTGRLMPVKDESGTELVYTVRTGSAPPRT